MDLNQDRAQLRGIRLVLTGYILWGVFPVFWAMYSHVPAVTVLYQRTVWSSVLLVGYLGYRRQLRGVLARVLLNRRTLATVVCSALLLALNWGSYIYALQQRQYFNAGLAYYIAPILSVVAAAVVMREPIRPRQWLATLLLALGTFLPAVYQGAAPWMAIFIASTWSGYVVVRKRVAVGTVEGLFLETALLALLGTVGLCLAQGPVGLIGAAASQRDILLFPLCGLVTVLPLAALVEGLRGCPLKLAAVVQYVSPTVQLLSSAICFGSIPSSVQLVGIGIIWVGVVVFVWGDLFAARKVGVVSTS
jgi:chloramphenicol-sensitive protein RarD